MSYTPDEWINRIINFDIVCPYYLRPGRGSVRKEWYWRSIENWALSSYICDLPNELYSKLIGGTFDTQFHNRAYLSFTEAYLDLQKALLHFVSNEKAELLIKHCREHEKDDLGYRL